MNRAAMLAVSLMFAVAGCGTLLDGPDNWCESDGDCREGRCDIERSMCVRDPETSLQIGIEVVPASDPLGLTPLPVSFPPIEVSGPSDAGDLSLPASVTALGMVHWIGEPISASITFTLISEIPGGPATRIETQTTPEAVMYGETLANYTVQLLPSQTYEITVEPNGDWRDDLPPLRGRFESLTGVNAELQYPDELAEVHGTIVDAEGRPQSGMIVRALDGVTGALVSSIYTTGPDGVFMVRLSPGTEAWLFSINASSERITAGSLTPTFAVDPGGLIEGPDGVRILVPPVSDQVIEYQGMVEVDGQPGQGAAATLSFSSMDVVDDTTGTIGTFRTMVASDASGAFYVQLLPGTYDVVVTPSDATLGILQEQDVRIDPGVSALRGQVFAVPERVLYNGNVQTLGGLNILDARVRAQARGGTFGETLPLVAIYARSSETLSDAMGQFALPLDIGLYDVFAEPPAGSNWPWAIRRDQPNALIRDIEFAPSLPLTVGEPVPLTGRVIYGELGDVPAGSAEVRAYAIVDDGARAIQVGRATTDAEGAFTLLLPPSL